MGDLCTEKLLAIIFRSENLTPEIVLYTISVLDRSNEDWSASAWVPVAKRAPTEGRADTRRGFVTYVVERSTQSAAQAIGEEYSNGALMVYSPIG